jgi:hypothetical protein
VRFDQRSKLAELPDDWKKVGRDVFFIAQISQFSIPQGSFQVYFSPFKQVLSNIRHVVVEMPNAGAWTKVVGIGFDTLRGTYQSPFGYTLDLQVTLATGAV